MSLLTSPHLNIVTKNSIVCLKIYFQNLSKLNSKIRQNFIFNEPYYTFFLNRLCSTQSAISKFFSF